MEEEKDKKSEIALVDCPICLESYSNERPPYILSRCGHSLCQCCLKKFLDGDDYI